MVTIDAVRAGLARYADREIIDRMQAGTIKRLAVGTAISIALQRGLDKFLASPASDALGIASDGCVDVDILRDTIKAQMPADGIKVDVIGISMTFRAPDIDAVYQDIMEGA